MSRHRNSVAIEWRDGRVVCLATCTTGARASVKGLGTRSHDKLERCDKGSYRERDFSVAIERYNSKKKKKKRPRIKCIHIYIYIYNVYVHKINNIKI